MTHRRRFLGLLFLLLTAVSANATITVLRHYRLGDSDPGATNGLAATSSVDSSGAANLTLSGSPTYLNPTYNTNSSLCLHFLGGQYGLATLLSNITDNFGIEAWVMTDTNSGSHFVCYNGNTAGNGWGILQSGTSYTALFGGVTIFGSAPAPTSTWTHVALVRDNGTATLYVNGVEAGSTTQSPNAPGNGFAIATVPENPGAGNWMGSMDDVRVFTFASGAFERNDLLVAKPGLSFSTQSNYLSLTWPSDTSRNYGLETATNLYSSNWNKLLAQLTNGLFTVTNSMSDGSRFYRLNSAKGPPCGTNLPPYLPSGLSLLANGNPVTSSNVTILSNATNTFDASAFVDPSKCAGDTLSWLWAVTMNGTQVTTGLSGTASSVLTMAPGLATNGAYKIDLHVSGSTGLSTNVTLNLDFGSAPPCLNSNTPIQLELTLREAPEVSDPTDRTNRYTSYSADPTERKFLPLNGVNGLNDSLFNVATNIIEVRVIGDATNCPSAYTYKWRLDLVGLFGDFHDRGVTGYLTPQLIIKRDALPSDSSFVVEVDFYLTVKRLADGRQDDFVFTSFNYDSGLDVNQCATCQTQTNACDTCPCTMELALPTTEPY